LGITSDGTYLYWANWGGTIGRANLDGTGVNQSFISTGGNPVSVVASGNYIYWTDYQSGAGAIGRANLDGTGVNQSFISGLSNPWGMAISGGYVYWTEYVYKESAGGTIGRAKLDGTGVNQSFLGGDLVDFNPGWIAIGAGHIYWSNPCNPNSNTSSSYSNTIGRANLDGTGVNRSFITGANNPFGLVIGP
jgi:hypothetical protein